MCKLYQSYNQAQVVLKESLWKLWKSMKATGIPKVLKTNFFKNIIDWWFISSKEKEKRVLECLEQNKSYRENPRSISCFFKRYKYYS